MIDFEHENSSRCWRFIFGQKKLEFLNMGKFMTRGIFADGDNQAVEKLLLSVCPESLFLLWKKVKKSGEDCHWQRGMMYFLSANFEKISQPSRNFARKPMRRYFMSSSNGWNGYCRGNDRTGFSWRDTAASARPSVHLRQSEVASADFRYSLRACTHGYPNG